VRERKQHYFHLYHFIQTLTYSNFGNNHIGDRGAQYLGKALQNNRVRENIAICIMFIFIISYRYSHILSSSAIKLEITVHNILVKDYNTTQWEIENNTIFIFNISCRPSHISTSVTITLETEVHNIWVKD
jgi:hypothetical protein